MPLQRRVPKLKGFTNPNRVEFAVVNLDALSARFQAGEEVTPAVGDAHRVLSLRSS